LLLTLMTFFAVVLAVFGVYSILSDLYLRDRSRLSRRVDSEFRQRQREKIQKTTLFKTLGQLTAEDEGKESLRDRFATLVEQSGLNLTPQRLLAILALAGTGCGLVVGLYCGSMPLGLAAAVLAVVCGFFYVLKRRSARLAKFMSQLPDAFDLMARIIRAGQTTAQAVQGVAEEFDQPVAG